MIHVEVDPVTSKLTLAALKDCGCATILRGLTECEARKLLAESDFPEADIERMLYPQRTHSPLN